MKRRIITLIGVVAIATAALFALDYFGFIPHKYYSAKRFGIEEIKSNTDADDDGIDDYTDILLSAREYVSTKPKYKSEYYVGGYSPDGTGVCTDVIWRALKGAGYDLKEMVDADILSNPDRYPSIEKPDSNIDFRRVRNLLPFFEAHAKTLTIDTSQIAEWQAGDIVIFKGHIAIVSNRRNKSGMPFIIHHANPYQLYYEEDALTTSGEIIGHFRWEK